MRKPRRNSRRVDAVVAADLLGEDAPHAELSCRLEREDDPAGRRSGDEVDHRFAVESAPVRREVAAQLARRRRILEDLELLDVRVAVAAALEQEVALAERAGASEQRLGLERDGLAQGGVERGQDGGHAASVTGSTRRISRTASKPRSGVTISPIPSSMHVATWTRSRVASAG